MAKKQALKSAGNRWLWRCATAFQCARLHESFKLLLVLCSSGFDVSQISTRAASVSTPCVAESQRGNHFFVRSPTYCQREGSTSDQEALSLVNQQTLR